MALADDNRICQRNPAIFKRWEWIRLAKLTEGDYVRNLEHGIPDSIVERLDVKDGTWHLIGGFQHEGNM